MQLGGACSRQTAFHWIFFLRLFLSAQETQDQRLLPACKTTWREGKQVQWLSSTPKEDSEHRKETTADFQQSWVNWGCMTPWKSSPAMFYLDSILHTPAAPLVWRGLESPRFFRSQVPIINSHNLADKPAIPTGSDKRSWHPSNPSHLHCFILFAYWFVYAHNANWHLIIQPS